MDRIISSAPLEFVFCDLCGSDHGVLIAVQQGFRVLRCRACGLVYVNPRPTADMLRALYADYHSRRGEDEASWNRLMSRVFRESAEMLCSTQQGARRGRLLDVGCGFGHFVSMMRQRGWDADGVDPSPTVVAAAVYKGHPVRLGTLEELHCESGSYDAVTMFYVLEHLRDPIGALRKVSDLLAPGGTVLIRVPHTTPIVRLLAPLGAGGALYDPPFHLYDFSPAVLGEMLRRTRFVDVRTFPGQPTLPSRLGSRIASLVFGALAAGIHAVSRGTVLLPGISKTTTARKPAD